MSTSRDANARIAQLEAELTKAEAEARRLRAVIADLVACASRAAWTPPTQLPHLHDALAHAVGRARSALSENGIGHKAELAAEIEAAATPLPDALSADFIEHVARNAGLSTMPIEPGAVLLGVAEDTPAACETCGGRGKIDVGMYPRTCPECGGEGEVGS